MVETAGKRPATGPRGSVDFARHFSLLAAWSPSRANQRLATGLRRHCLVRRLWRAALGGVALTWRGHEPWWRLPSFVGIAVSLSMVSAALSLYATGHSAWLSALGPALPLALSSGVGAAGYAVLFRWLGARLPRSAYVFLPAACIAATWVVLASGAYRYGGGLWFASAWWVAFSAVLWFLDGR
jgi:hypothetical protein